jgi:hypothetical protein
VIKATCHQRDFLRFLFRAKAKADFNRGVNTMGGTGSGNPGGPGTGNPNHDVIGRFTERAPGRYDCGYRGGKCCHMPKGCQDRHWRAAKADRDQARAEGYVEGKSARDGVLDWESFREGYRFAINRLMNPAAQPHAYAAHQQASRITIDGNDAV